MNGAVAHRSRPHLELSRRPAARGRARASADRGRRRQDRERRNRRGRRGARDPGARAAGRRDRRPLGQARPARLHRRAYPLSPDPRHRLLRRAAARLAAKIHLRRGAEVRRSRATAKRSRASSSTNCSARARRRRASIAPSIPQSVDAFFAESERRGARMIAGKVMMDRNAPAALMRHAAARLRREQGADRALARHAGGSITPITPRFAVTSSEAQLEAAGALARENRDAYVQTHLEREFRRDRLRQAAVSLGQDLSRRLRALSACSARARSSAIASISRNPRSPRWRAATRVAAFCPTSNLFLGSGLFDKKRLDDAGVRVALATDVGGGTSYSMLQTASGRLQGAADERPVLARAAGLLSDDARQRPRARPAKPDRRDRAGPRGRPRRARLPRDPGDGPPHGIARGRSRRRSCSC